MQRIGIIHVSCYLMLSHLHIVRFSCLDIFLIYCLMQLYSKEKLTENFSWKESVFSEKDRLCLTELWNTLVGGVGVGEKHNTQRNFERPKE